MFPIPLRDSNPTHTKIRVTYYIILFNILVFCFQAYEGFSAEFFLRWGFVPKLFFNENQLHQIVTSIFIHTGVLHLFGNMFFLFIFGDNMEERLGGWKFLSLYLVAGGFGNLAHGFMNTNSIIPAIGASAAVSGIMGAYFVKFPYAKIKVWYLIFVVSLPAFLYLGFWMFWQLWNHFNGSQGIAFFAHIIGFVVGVVFSEAVTDHGREIALQRYIKKKKRFEKEKRISYDRKVWENIGRYKDERGLEFASKLKNSKKSYEDDLEREIFEDDDFESIEKIHEKRYSKIKKLKKRD